MIAAPSAPPPAVLIASMREDCAKGEAQRARRTPRTVRARLERLEAFDQAGREALSQLGDATGPDRGAYDKALACMLAKDKADQAELKAILPPSGWFTRETYGKKAALGAWLVADHAVDDPDLMRIVLARMAPAAVRGGYDGTSYAIMFDRVAIVFDHRPQRYGTQVECHAGAWRPMALEAPEQVDARRRTAGFKETEAAYLESYSDLPCS